MSVGLSLGNDDHFRAHWLLAWLHWLIVLSPDLPWDMAWTFKLLFNRRKRSDHLLYLLCSVTILSYPGGWVPKILIGERVAIFGSNLCIPAVWVSFLVVMLTPVHKLYRRLPVRIMLEVMTTFGWMRAIVAMTNFAVETYPGSAVAGVLIGTMGGCAGGLLEQLDRKYVAREKMEVSTLGVRIAFTMAALTYAVHPQANRKLLPFLPSPWHSDNTQVVVYLLLLAWSLLVSLYKPMNPWGWFESYLFEPLQLENRVRLQRSHLPATKEGRRRGRFVPISQMGTVWIPNTPGANESELGAESKPIGYIDLQDVYDDADSNSDEEQHIKGDFLAPPKADFKTPTSPVSSKSDTTTNANRDTGSNSTVRRRRKKRQQQ